MGYGSTTLYSTLKWSSPIGRLNICNKYIYEFKFYCGFNNNNKYPALINWFESIEIACVYY